MSYSDAGAIAFSEELERIYKEDLSRGPRDTYIDVLGAARWYGDFRILTEMGLSEPQATQSVRNEIYRISGIPVPVVAGLQGPLIRVADGWKDNTGYVNPIVCHFGDGLSLDIRDPGLCDTHLDAIADAGYQIVRTWTVLRGPYWAGRECGPDFQSNYRECVVQFAHKLHMRGLRWMVSQGDLLAQYTTQANRKHVLQLILEAIASVHPDVIAFVDIGNESWQNGEDNPERLSELARFIQPFAHNATITLTSPPSEEADDLRNYTFHVYDVHGSRDGRYWDKVRHIFSLGYERGSKTRNGIQSEPFGQGDLVSASSNKQEIDAGVYMLGAAVSCMARQVWTYFSGPGVKATGSNERLWEMPGFYETPDIIKQLPADLMTFQTLIHGGASQNRRIYAVPSVDETRCDHAIHDDGRFVCAIYGPQWKKAKIVRDHDVIAEIPCGDKGKIVVGKLK